LQTKRFHNIFLLIMLGTGVVFPTVAAAQAIPGAADPGRITGDMNNKQRLPEKQVQAEVQKHVITSDIPKGADKVVFVLHDISIEGMTAYSSADVALMYRNYINRKISLVTVFKIAEQLQQKYLDDGYALTKVIVPQQDFTTGHIRLTVIEGYISEVEFKGTIRPSAYITDVVQRIREMHPLNAKKLERIMLLLNDLPGAKFSAILATAKRPNPPPGAIRLVLESADVPRFSGSIGLNNYGSNFDGPWQISGAANVTHVGINYSDLGIVATAARPADELQYGSLHYSLPLFGASGTNLIVTATRALTQPGDTLKDLELKGRSDQLSMKMTYPLIRQRDQTCQLDFDFDAKDSRTNISGDRLYDDRLRILNIGVDYSFADRFVGLNVLQFKASQGLNILGVRETGSPDLSRAQGRSDFRKFNATIGRRQVLPKNFEIYGLIDGQFTDDPLLSTEEYGFGGSQLGRGYDSSEITGDRGIAGSLEFRYNTGIPKTQVGLQPYVFYDIGKVWNIDPGAKNQISAASAGTGIRADFPSAWKVDLNLAFPLTKNQDNPPHYTQPNGPRGLLSIVKNF
jgi:hemolysin activation/secretion protein